MKTRYKFVYGGDFHKKHRILYNIIIFLWRWDDRIKYKWTYVINKNNYRKIFKKSLVGALIDLFWAVFYPLAIIKETLCRLFWRGVYKAEFFMEYLQYKFSKKEPEPPIDAELVKAIEAFYVSDRYKRAMIRQQLRDARKLLEKESQENINDK